MAVKKLKHARVSAQKIIRQSSKAKLPQKQRDKVKVKDRKALVVAQEIKFARLLASNDKRVRDKVLKNLKKWLTVRSKSSFAFVEADFLRLWKGLFYCMWMSDKPLIQEELAESLSNIVHCFTATDTFLLYTHCTLKTLATEWYGIDQYRIDKFSMLVRRVYRQIFNACKQRAWNKDCILGVSDLLEKLILSPQCNLGFFMHTVEVYLEELAKVGGGNIPRDLVTIMVKPFVLYLVATRDRKQIAHVTKHIFKYLIFQSDVGMDYVEKFNAWKQAGFPTGRIDAMEKIEVGSDGEDDRELSDEEDQNDQDKNEHYTEKPLDPRAGRVDVELPQLDFDPNDIVSLLKQYRFSSASSSKTRRRTAYIITQLSQLAKGKMPGCIKDVELPEQNKKGDSRKAVRRLTEFNDSLLSYIPKRKRYLSTDSDDEGEDIGEDEFENESEDDAVAEANGDDLFEQENEDSGNERKDKDGELEHENEKGEVLTGGEREKINAGDELNGDKRENKYITLPTKSIASKSDSIVSNLKKKLKKRKADTCTDENIHFDKSKKQGIAKLLLLKANKKVKKIKVMQNGSDSETALEMNAKLKKSKQIEIGGNWDISDNVPPPKLTKLVPEKRSKVQIINNVTVDANELKNQIGNQAMWLTSVLAKIEDANNKSAKNPIEPNKQMTEQRIAQRSEQSPKKRVKIVLQRNTAQNTSEYIRQIRQSPAIPFDANRKPLASALKANAIPSPVNPFYKRKLK